MWSTLTTAKDIKSRVGDEKLRILDCRHQLTSPDYGPHQYAAGHIPGAIHAHIDRDLSSTPRRDTGRHPLRDPTKFRATLRGWGHGDTVQVVGYDDQGGVWGVRAWWLLQDYGHNAVALLDGGIQAWTAKGGKLTTQAPNFKRRRFDGQPGRRPKVEAEHLRHALERGHVRALDARAPERYRGETEPIDPVAGHIPGAGNLPYTGGLDVPEDLRATEDEVVVYCGSGVTACVDVLALERGGVSAKLYPGSWSEWSSRDLPVERG